MENIFEENNIGEVNSEFTGQSIETIQNCLYSKIINDILKYFEINCIKLINSRADLQKTLMYFEDWLKDRLDQLSGDLKKRVEKILPKLLPILLENRYIESMDPNRVLDLLKIITEIAINPEYKLELSIGIGGTMNDLNVRILSYMVAPLKILSDLDKLNKELVDEKENLSVNLPNVRVVSAHNAAVLINNMDPKKVNKNWKRIKQILLYFTEKMHPDIADRVRFDEDLLSLDLQILENDNGEKELVLPDYMEELMDVLMVEELIYGGELREDIKSIRRMGAAHGGADGADRALVYAILHPLLLNDIVSKDVDAEDLPDGRISLGGNAEKRFNKIRNFLIDDNNKKRQSSEKTNFQTHDIHSAMCIVKSGKHTPVYYSMPGEYTAHDLINEKPMPKHQDIEITINYILENLINDPEWIKLDEFGKRNKAISIIRDLYKNILLV